MKAAGGVGIRFVVLVRPNPLGGEIVEYHVPGVKDIAIEFTSSASKFDGVPCGGINFVITDWQTFRPLNLGWAIAVSLRMLYPNDWHHQQLSVLLGNEEIHQRVIEGKSPAEIEKKCTPATQVFSKRRATYLLYQ